MALQPFTSQKWQEHLKSLAWKQGEHVLISAPTGAGKTTMAAQLVEKRSHTVVFVSKMKDPTFSKDFRGYRRLTEWPRNGPRSFENKILLWPQPRKTVEETLQEQRDVFRQALDAIMHQGNRCIVIDESLMMNDPKLVGIGTQIGMAHYYGRSSGVSMVDLTQRPSWIPKVIYSSVSHAYIARTMDVMDRKKLSDMGGIDARLVGDNLAALSNKHDYVYLNPHGESEPVIVNTRN